MPNKPETFDIVTLTIELPATHVKYLVDTAKEYGVTPSVILYNILDKFSIAESRPPAPTPAQSQVINSTDVKKVEKGLGRFVFDFRSNTVSGILSIIAPQELTENLQTIKTAFSLISEDNGYDLTFNLSALEHYQFRKEN